MTATRTALVVGASRGIGRACALELAQQGFGTVLIAHVSDDDAVAEARAAIEATGATVGVVRVDVAAPDGPHALASFAREQQRPLDALVYSAGHRVLGPSLELDAEAWERTFGVTLTGFVRTVQTCAPLMSRGAKMVGISGLSGLRAYSPMHLMMGTAKAAAHHAMRYLAWDLTAKGINLNMVCCGAVRTEGVARDLTEEQYEAFVGSVVEKVPSGILPEPAAVASVVAFLCSPGAELLVGQVIVADGGETLR